jgi:hypothetical protein
LGESGVEHKHEGARSLEGHDSDEADNHRKEGRYREGEEEDNDLSLSLNSH